MYQSLVAHTFSKMDNIYVRDDSKYIIMPCGRIGKRVFNVVDADTGNEVGSFNRLKDAKIVFGVERKG